MKQIDFMEIKGFKVGQAQDLEAATGCTVMISEKGATVGVDVRGGAPGTRETDLLNPVNLVQKAHAILLAGGSAFGLDAARVMERAVIAAVKNAKSLCGINSCTDLKTSQ
jgi:L-aminopeptidase/D-esterase-like protein